MLRMSDCQRDFYNFQQGREAIHYPYFFKVNLMVEGVRNMAVALCIDFGVASNAYHFQKLGIILSRSWSTSKTQTVETPQLWYLI